MKPISHPLRRTAAGVLASVGLIASGCSGGEEQPEPSAPIAVGAAAPAWSGEDVRGHRVDLPGRGPVLLAFLHPTAESGSARLAAARSSAVVVRSMATQYGGRGLRAVIADAAEHAGYREDLLNLSYDWHLDGVLLLAPEPGASAADSYGAGPEPSTYLIGPDGTVRQRWVGTLSAQAVGPAVRQVVT